MARVKKEVIEKIKEEVNKLPEDLLTKCHMCNETLTHLAMKLQTELKAPEATVLRIIEERHNKLVPINDRVPKDSFRERVKRHSGRRNKKKKENIVTNDQNLSGSKTHLKERKRREKHFALQKEVWLEACDALGINVSNDGTIILSKEALKILHRGFAAKYHPDKGGDADRFRQIQEAYSVLKLGSPIKIPIDAEV